MIAHGLTVNGILTGTAITQSATDGTSGRLLSVGYQGLGASQRGGQSVDFTDLTRRAGFYGFLGNLSIGAPLGTVFGGGMGWRTTYRTTGTTARYAADLVIYNGDRSDTVNGRMFFRTNAASEVLLPWREVYHQGSVLGTVSQSAGLPTGAAMQGNASSAAPTGGWTERLADGFQTIHHAMTSSASADTVWTYNSVFLTGSTPVIGIQPVGAKLCAEVIARTATSCTFSIRDRTTGDRVAAPVDLIARGRWSTLT